MPGYVIHLCVAKEYIKKHSIQNEKDFFDGTVFPDFTTNKDKTHYSKFGSSETNLYKYLLTNKLDNDFQKGYFLHLLSDGLFYHKYFFGWQTIDCKLLYNDYDIINKDLIAKYNLTYIPKGVEKFFYCEKEGKTIDYHYDKVCDFIEEVSNYDLHNLANEIITKKDFKFLYVRRN